MRWIACLFICLTATAGPAEAKTRLLFIGNSFTFAANSPVMRYRADQVHDLNGEGIGGVPALFKVFTEEAGLDYDVSLETSPGKNFDFHYTQRLDVIDQSWDVVVMQGYSTLDAAKPGDPTELSHYAGLIAERLHARNPGVDIRLTATWSRADQTYLPTGHWFGQDISAMTRDIRAGYDHARAASPYIAGVMPVGEAWNLAMAKGFADPNPYDGASFGQVSLWSWDQYHGSAYGYYLEALIVFG